MFMLQQTVINIINKHYAIVDSIDLFYHDPRSLAKKLSAYENASWSEKQRLVILYQDTDYFPSLNSLGNSMYNFFRLCADFNIPSDHILLLTNHHGITDHISKASKEILNEPGPLVIETTLWLDRPEPGIPWPDWEINHKKLYICPNNKERQHRLFTLCALADADLLDQGVISYHFKGQ